MDNTFEISSSWHSGEDGVRLWDLESRRQVTVPAYNPAFSATTVLRWATIDSSDVLFAGTALGHVSAVIAERGVRYPLQYARTTADLVYRKASGTG
jgi:hypothetical protein